MGSVGNMHDINRPVGNKIPCNLVSSPRTSEERPPVLEGLLCSRGKGQKTAEDESLKRLICHTAENAHDPRESERLRTEII